MQLHSVYKTPGTPLTVIKVSQELLCVVKYHNDASLTNFVIFGRPFLKKYPATKVSGSFCVMGPKFRLVCYISLRHVELVGQVVIICEQLLPLLVHGVQPVLGTLQAVFSF